MKKQTTSEHIVAVLQRRLNHVAELPLRLQQWWPGQGSRSGTALKSTVAPELDWQPRRRLSVCSEVGPRDSLFATFVLPPITDRHGR